MLHKVAWSDFTSWGHGQKPAAYRVYGSAGEHVDSDGGHEPAYISFTFCHSAGSSCTEGTPSA